MDDATAGWRTGYDYVALCVPLGFFVLALEPLAVVAIVKVGPDAAWTVTFEGCLALSYAVMGWSWLWILRTFRSSGARGIALRGALSGFALAGGLMAAGNLAYAWDLKAGGNALSIVLDILPLGYALTAIGFTALVLGMRRLAGRGPEVDVGSEAATAVPRSGIASWLVLAGYALVAGGAVATTALLHGPWIHFPRGMLVYSVTGTLALCVIGWSWWSFGKKTADPILSNQLHRPVRLYALGTAIVAFAYWIPPVAPGTLAIALGYLVVAIGLWAIWSRQGEPTAPMMSHQPV